MMDIYIKIQNSRVDLQELKDSDDDIIYITKSTRLRFFGVVQTSTPVDGNICLTIEEQSGRINGSASRYLANII